MLKKCAQLLKSHLSKKFPQVVVDFYLSCRSNSIENYPDFIDKINKFLAKDLSPRSVLVYPQLVLTVKSKFNYIICRKSKKEKY